jgi:predicted RNase H-like nuclease (RuvC/YqgF family)
MKPQQVDKAIRDLRTALKSLSDQSLKTSRHLDDTYYTILEKASLLRQTIGSLQELSGLTRELHENFESDTTELVDDVQGQFDNFENFDTQQQQIIGLEDRIHEGKQKADSLTDRLAKAKDRVDARAQAELEWETKNTRTVLLELLPAAKILTLPCRSNPHILGDPRLHSCPHLRFDYFPPFQANKWRPAS